MAPNLRLLPVDEPIADDDLGSVVDRDQLERGFCRLSLDLVRERGDRLPCPRPRDRWHLREGRDLSIDVDGERLVFTSGSNVDTDPADVAGIEAMVASMAFE